MERVCFVRSDCSVPTPMTLDKGAETQLEHTTPKTMEMIKAVEPNAAMNKEGSNALWIAHSETRNALTFSHRSWQG